MEIELDDSFDLSLFRPDGLYNNLNTLIDCINKNNNAELEEDFKRLIHLELLYLTGETLLHADGVGTRVEELVKSFNKANLKVIK